MTDQPIEPTNPIVVPDDTPVPPPPAEDANQDPDATESAS